MSIQIITDSAAVFPEGYIEKYHIHVIPLYVTQGDNIYKDGIDILPEKIYRDMQEGIFYKTSQISYADFNQVFSSYAEQGKDVLYLCFSGGISGTYQTACLAKTNVSEQYPDVRIEVLDTHGVIAGLGMHVAVVAKANLEGADMDQLIDLSQRCTHQIEHMWTVTDLEFLYRGGRLSRGSAIVGNALKIHPSGNVRLNTDGGLELLFKARGTKRLIRKFIDYIDDRAYDPANQMFYIADAVCGELVEEFADAMKKQYGDFHYKRMTICPVVGTHLGPGSMTVFYANNADVGGLVEHLDD